MHKASDPDHTLEWLVERDLRWWARGHRVIGDVLYAAGVVIVACTLVYAIASL